MSEFSKLSQLQKRSRCILKWPYSVSPVFWYKTSWLFIKYPEVLFLSSQVLSKYQTTDNLVSRTRWLWGGPLDYLMLGERENRPSFMLLIKKQCSTACITEITPWGMSAPGKKDMSHLQTSQESRTAESRNWSERQAWKQQCSQINFIKCSPIVTYTLLWILLWTGEILWRMRCGKKKRENQRKRAWTEVLTMSLNSQRKISHRIPVWFSWGSSTKYDKVIRRGVSSHKPRFLLSCLV